MSIASAGWTDALTGELYKLEAAAQLYLFDSPTVAIRLSYHRPGSASWRSS